MDAQELRNLQEAYLEVYSEIDEAKPEQVDLYDIILSHLLDEGFASDEKSAEAIMGSMSESWVESIVEGMGLSVGVSKLAGNVFSNPRTSAEKGAKNFQRNVADPVGYAIKGAAKSILSVGDEKNKQMMQKRRPN